MQDKSGNKKNASQEKVWDFATGKDDRMRTLNFPNAPGYFLFAEGDFYEKLRS